MQFVLGLTSFVGICYTLLFCFLIYHIVKWKSSMSGLWEIILLALECFIPNFWCSFTPMPCCYRIWKQLSQMWGTQQCPFWLHEATSCGLVPPEVLLQLWLHTASGSHCPQHLHPGKPTAIYILGIETLHISESRHRTGDTGCLFWKLQSGWSDSQLCFPAGGWPMTKKVLQNRKVDKSDTEIFFL